MEPEAPELLTPVTALSEPHLTFQGWVCVDPKGEPYWPSAGPDPDHSLRVCFGPADELRLHDLAVEGWRCVLIGSLSAMSTQWERSKYELKLLTHEFTNIRSAAVARVRQVQQDAAETASAVLEIAGRYGQIDGAHHKMWVIDRMIRALVRSDAAYAKWVADNNAGEEGPDTYEWDQGIPP